MESYIRPKRAFGGIFDANSLQMLEEKRDIFYLLSFILHNTKPVGHQVSYSTQLCQSNFIFYHSDSLEILNLPSLHLSYNMSSCSTAGSCWLSHLNPTSRRF